jgi:hypothetical protein
MAVFTSDQHIDSLHLDPKLQLESDLSKPLFCDTKNWSPFTLGSKKREGEQQNLTSF